MPPLSSSRSSVLSSINSSLSTILTILKENTNFSTRQEMTLCFIFIAVLSTQMGKNKPERCDNEYLSELLQKEKNNYNYRVGHDGLVCIYMFYIYTYVYTHSKSLSVLTYQLKSQCADLYQLNLFQHFSETNKFNSVISGIE